MSRVINNNSRNNENNRGFFLQKWTASSIALVLIVFLCNATTLTAFIGVRLDSNKILRSSNSISVHDGRRIHTPTYMIHDDISSSDGISSPLSSSSSRSPAFVSTLSSSDPNVKSMLMDAAAELTRASTGGSLLGVKSLGIDYGTVRTGVAVTVGYDPRPLTILATSNDTTCQDIVHLVQQEQATRIVLGLPLHKNGTVARQTIVTMAFARNLTSHVYATLGPNFPVYLWDERYTSKEAEARMVVNKQEDRYIDADAACIILEHYYSDGGAGAKMIDLPLQEQEILKLKWEKEKRRIDDKRELYEQQRETNLNAKKTAMEKAKIMEEKLAEKYGTSSNNKKKNKKKKSKKKNNTSGDGGKKWITF